jgi:hypothetical protein
VGRNETVGVVVGLACSPGVGVDLSDAETPEVEPDDVGGGVARKDTLGLSWF